MAQPIRGQLSCPDCGARASPGSRVCAQCGGRFVEDAPLAPRARPRPRAIVAWTGAAVLVAALLFVVLDAGGGGDGRGTARADRPGPDVLSQHPLSARAAERRLEERFAAPRDDDTASARCSALEPRPAHAIRWCSIRYPGGTERTVIVLTNPQGRELLVER